MTNILSKVAKVAKLDLTEDEKKKFSKDLENILESFGALDDANVKNIKPTFQPVEVKNVVREDIIEKSLSQEDALKNSPHTENKYFKGPKAID